MKNTLLSMSAQQRKKINKRQNIETPHILVVSTTGLGDSLWGTPSIRALKKRYPKSYLSVLTSPIGKEVYLNNPYIDDIFVIKDPALFPMIKTVPKIKEKKIDTALIFHLSQRPVLPLVYLSGPETLVGTKNINKGFDHLLTHLTDSPPIHEIERRMNLTKIIGVTDFSPHMEMFITEEENNAALSYIDSHSLNIGIHPGAKNRFKQWHPKNFITLGRRLAKEKKAKIWITGDKSEKNLAKSIATTIPGGQSLAGKLPVRLTAALIEKFDLFITNDSGPMHMAFAMNTPTIALFAPTNPKICGPYQISHCRVVQKSQTCQPCIRKQCHIPFCMDQISPDQVWEECLKD